MSVIAVLGLRASLGITALGGVQGPSIQPRQCGRWGYDERTQFDVGIGQLKGAYVEVPYAPRLSGIASAANTLKLVRMQKQKVIFKASTRSCSQSA